MKSVSFFLTILTLSCYFTASGQYTETINNNRPGGSQGAFSVGTNVLQFETGFGIGQENHSLLQTQATFYLFFIPVPLYPSLPLIRFHPSYPTPSFSPSTSTRSQRKEIVLMMG